MSYCLDVGTSPEMLKSVGTSPPTSSKEDKKLEKRRKKEEKKEEKRVAEEQRKEEKKREKQRKKDLVRLYHDIMSSKFHSQRGHWRHHLRKKERFPSRIMERIHPSLETSPFQLPDRSRTVQRVLKRWRKNCPEVNLFGRWVRLIIFL